MLVEEVKKILFTEIYKLSPLAQEAVKILFEYYNNCTVPPGYDVHYKDLNPENNSPENLQMLSHSDHQKLHASLKYF